MAAKSPSAPPQEPDPASDDTPAMAPAELTPAALAIIEHWVQLADSLGFPKSTAQIYGYIFTSRRLVTAQDCVDALKISRSSAGQGLKTLRDLGAIRAGFELGARREAFMIEPDLGVMIQSMLNGRIVPAFDTFFSQVDSIQKSLRSDQDGFLIGRIQKLHRWRYKIGRIKRWLLQ